MRSTPTSYAKRVEAVKVAYEPRILDLLGRLKAELAEVGYEAQGPDDWSDEEYVWCLGIPIDAEEGLWVDVRFTLVESWVREGSEAGVAFAIGVSGSDGCVLGHHSPYNYTPDVWVPLDDPEAIEGRFQLMEMAEDVVGCVGRVA